MNPRGATLVEGSVGNPSVVVSLLTDEQEFQVLQAKDAVEAAKRHGLKVEVLFAGSKAVQQIHQLFRHDPIRPRSASASSHRRPPAAPV